MTRAHAPSLLVLASLLLLGACATRPVNPPITQADLKSGYRFETRQAQSTNSKENLVILAFSGGGTRAAAFSYGVLEALRDRILERNYIINLLAGIERELNASLS